LLAQAQLTREERKKRRRALDNIGVPSFDEFLSQQKMVLEKKPIEILQLNIGLYCNQVTLPSIANHTSHPGVELMANLKSISRRCHLFEVAFVWESAKATIHLPLGCLQSGVGSCSKPCFDDAAAQWLRQAPHLYLSSLFLSDYCLSTFSILNVHQNRDKCTPKDILAQY
jgi:hypothetical protein